MQNEYSLWALVLSAGLFFTACGDDSGDTGESCEISLSGSISTTDAAGGVSLSVTDADGNQIGTAASGDDGSFSATTTGGFPFTVSGEGLSVPVVGGSLSLKSSFLKTDGCGESAVAHVNDVSSFGAAQALKSLSIASTTQDELETTASTALDAAIGAGVNYAAFASDSAFAPAIDGDTSASASAAALVAKTVSEAAADAESDGATVLDEIASNEATPFMEEQLNQVGIAANFIINGYSAADTNAGLEGLVDSENPDTAVVLEAVGVLGGIMEEAKATAADADVGDASAQILAIQGVKAALSYIVEVLTTTEDLSTEALSNIANNAVNIAITSIIENIKSGNIDAANIKNVGTAAGEGLEAINETTDLTSTELEGDDLTDAQNLVDTVVDAESSDEDVLDDVLAMVGGNASALTAELLSVVGVTDVNSDYMLGYKSEIEGGSGVTDLAGLQSLVDTANTALDAVSSGGLHPYFTSFVYDSTGIDEGWDLAIDNDGNIIMAGRSGSNSVIAKLADDGTPDEDWQTNGVSLAAPSSNYLATTVMIDGRGDYFAVIRHNGSGTTVVKVIDQNDGTNQLFTHNYTGQGQADPVWGLKMTGDQVMIVGYSTTADRLKLTQYTYDDDTPDAWSLDSSYGTSGHYDDTSTRCGTRNAVYPLYDAARNQFLISGSFSSWDSCYRQADGTFNAASGGNPYSWQSAKVLVPGATTADDRIIFAVPQTVGNSNDSVGFYVLNPNNPDFTLGSGKTDDPRDIDGSPDDGIYTTGVTIYTPGAVYYRDAILDSDGKLVMVGIADADPDEKGIVVRYNLADFTLDTTFGSGNGYVLLDDVAGGTGQHDEIKSIVQAANGDYVLSGISHNGTDTDAFVVRLKN